MMKEEDIKYNWYYFRSLTNQLQDTEQYVDHTLNSEGEMCNATTFSNEFAKILMLAASEFETIAKALCEEAHISMKWNSNIISISKAILRTYPNIGNTEILTPYSVMKPLKNWNIISTVTKKGKQKDVLVGLSWWQNHNDVKHNRKAAFMNANLKNSVDAMGSLMIIELYLSQAALGNIDCITEIGCSYFDCRYGLSPIMGNHGIYLPDFS